MRHLTRFCNKVSRCLSPFCHDPYSGLQQHLGAHPGRSKGQVEAHRGDPGQGQGPHGNVPLGRGAELFLDPSAPCSWYPAPGELLLIIYLSLYFNCPRFKMCCCCKGRCQPLFNRDCHEGGGSKGSQRAQQSRMVWPGLHNPPAAACLGTLYFSLTYQSFHHGGGWIMQEARG